MCIICVDLEKGKLTPSEARRALSELEPQLDNEHLAEVENTIEILEDEEGRVHTLAT